MKRGIYTRYVSEDGLSAYNILSKFENDCPIKLLRARSMKRASIDYENKEEAIISWYEAHKMSDEHLNNEIR